MRPLRRSGWKAAVTARYLLRMTFEIALVLVVLAGAVLFFVTGWLRQDIVALLAMVTLGVTGVISPAQAVAGFSNPAIIAVAGMFVISAGLSRTGVARVLGRQVVRVGGERETTLVVVLMLTSGVLSGFMNNVGVAAMLLPVVVDIARKADLSPSKLLIPMALGAQLGGLTTLIGTSPNLLASDALRDAGLEPLRFFDFTPIGAVLLGAGTLFVAFAGPRLLPTRDPEGSDGVPRRGIRESVRLNQRLFALELPARSHLDGRSLEESLIGSALGLNVLAIEREDERRRLAPPPASILRAGDRLIVHGRPDLLLALQGRRHLAPEEDRDPSAWFISKSVRIAEVVVSEASELVGVTLNQADLRQELGVAVLAILRGGRRRRTHLQDTPLEVGDRLLVQGPNEQLEELRSEKAFAEYRLLSPDEAIEEYGLEGRLTSLRVTEDSLLGGKTLAETHLGDAMGLAVLGIVREGVTELNPDPTRPVQVGDVLLIKAKPGDLFALRGLQRLEVLDDVDVTSDDLESDRAGFVEIVLSPRSTLVGKTLRQLQFRNRFGMTAVAIWRDGRAIRTGLRDEALRFGDALLLYGPRARAKQLLSEADVIVLTEMIPEPMKTKLAPLSLVIMVASILPVILGWLPISIGVMLGATLMVVSRCVTVDEAYRAVDWPTIVLIAGMISLGVGLDQTGAARMLGETVLGGTGEFGPRAVLATLCVLTALGAQIIPGTALVVLMAPIALSTAADLALSPQALVMGVTLAATSLASPVAHPAHALVMAPAGYRFSDFLRLGIPLTVLVVLVIVVALPFFLPL